MNTLENPITLTCPYTKSSFFKTKNSYICTECELKITSPDNTKFSCPEFAKIIINTFPYPIASIYMSLENEKSSLKDKRHALYFTVYQLMRCISIPFFSAYLYKEKLPDNLSERKIDSLNNTLVRLRSPYFSDWIAVLFKIGECQSDFEIPIFDTAINNYKNTCIGTTTFKEIMDDIKDTKVKVPTEYGLEYGRKTELNLLEAFLGLRNATAHAGRTLDEVCNEDIQFYRPILDELLKKFAWISTCNFLQLNGSLFDDITTITRLSGAKLPSQEKMSLSDNLYKSFKLSPIIIEFPSDKSTDTLPLYPFLFDQIKGENVCIYDGHNLRDDGKSTTRIIFYLANDKRHPLDDAKIDNLPNNLIKPGEKLRQLLQGRKVRWELNREDITPFTLADCANEFSFRNVENQIGKKYLPECYLERNVLLKPLYDFLLETPIDKNYKYRGMFWLGHAGSGKTAMLTHVVKHLLQKQHIVLFLRGDNISPYEKGNILFQNILHKIGIKSKDFSSFTELFNKLKDSIKKTQNEKPSSPQRFIFVFDAINEAPLMQQIMEELIELLTIAKNYPFIRIVFSIRSEAFFILKRKRLENQPDLLISVKPLLLPANNNEIENELPAYICTPLDQNEAAQIYKTYQQRGQACLTSWNDLSVITKQLLLNPLYLHLFHEVFQNKAAEDISGEPINLFEAFITEKCYRNTYLKEALKQLSNRMLKTGKPDFTDLDALELRQEWQINNVLTDQEMFFRFSPMEIAEMEGILQKQINEGGGGYRIVFQPVREFLLFQSFKDRYPKMTAENALQWESTSHKYSQLPEYNSVFYWLIKFYVKENRVSDAALLYSSKLSLESKQQITHALRDTILSNKEDLGDLGLSFTKSIVLTPEIEVENIERLYTRINVDLFDALSDLTHCTTIADIIFTVAEKLLQLHQSSTEDAEFAHSLYISYIRLGDMAGALGNLQEALSYLEKGLELAENLYKKFPNNTKLARNRFLSYSRLGQVMKEKGDFSSAQKFLSQGMEIATNLHQNSPNNAILKQDLANFYSSFGDLAITDSNTKEAIKHYKQAIKATKELSSLNPSIINYSYDLAVLYNKIGKALLVEDITEAYQHYMFSSEMLEEFITKKNQHINLIYELSNSYDGLGDIARARNIYSDALSYYNKSLELRTQLYQQFPNNIQFSRKLAMSYNKIGDISKDKENFNEAMKNFDSSLQIREKLYNDLPNNNLLIKDLSSSYIRITDLLINQHNLDQALENINKAIKLQEILYKIENCDSSITSGLTISYEKAGNILKSKGDFEKAKEFYEKAEKLKKLSHIPKNLALTGAYEKVDIEKENDTFNSEATKDKEAVNTNSNFRFGTLDFDNKKLRILSSTTEFFTEFSNKSIFAGSEGFYFTVIEGTDFGRVFLLEKPEMVLGRSDEADIQVDDEKSSRKHLKLCMIKNHKGEFRAKIVDLNSKNGVFVNGIRVYEENLRSGDTIKVGDTILKFEIKDRLDVSYHDKLYQQTTRDVLTGLSNRNYFRNELRKFASLSARYNRALSLIMLDIDSFKKINDTYGHDVGNNVLKSVAEILMQHVRTHDVAARFGGEEFVMLLPETNLEEAVVIAERIKTAVENTDFNPAGCRHNVTISIGVAEYLGDGTDIEEVIKKADEALYKAKSSGRNQVCAFPITS